MDKRNREDVGMDTEFKEGVKELIHYLDILKQHGFSEENAIQIMILLQLDSISSALNNPCDGMNNAISWIKDLFDQCIGDNGFLTVRNID